MSDPAYELADVRRFVEPWERYASLRLRERDGSVLEEYRKHGPVVDGGTLEAAQRAAARAWLADTIAGKRSVLVVDTNEHATNISALLRAKLVELGRVAEAGVPLPGGAVAGVGDLVEARRNAWDLAGYEGNARGPVNRETYRVTAIRPDGGLRAERLDGGPPVTLPAAYVTEHLSLGYASTVHSVQGRTVDTAHAVITPRTGAASLYVGLSRGRQVNTAYVTTVQVPDDSPPGQASTVERRDPAAVLADILDRDDDNAAALRIEEDSAALARSARTAGDRMADAASLLAPGRIASVLDRLAVDGALTAEQRRRLAADPATSQLGMLLRQAELAGRDGEAALAAAATDRPLDGAESIGAVLHSRLAARLGPLVPGGDRFTDRIPAVPDPTWRRYLERLAENADRRARELGTRTAEEPPRWAREALGPVPARPVERLDWEERAGRVAAYREMAGHDDQAVALGAAPPPGKVEHHAAWHSAWRALGRPESCREEAGMSDGTLLLRVRAYRREEAWAPAYVADELDGTAREAARRQQDAVLFAARADTAPEADRDALRRIAVEAAAYADILDQRVRDLTEADDMRAGWYVHTAETRAAADRARAELADRGIDPDVPADAVTVPDWLAGRDALIQAEDTHRPITSEADLVDTRVETDLVNAHVFDTVETGIPDVRDTATAEPAVADEGRGRVATAERTAAAVERAQRALLELRARASVDARGAEEAHQIEEAHRAVEHAPDVAAVAELVD